MTASPRFLITVDTEGDNLWDRPRTVTTKNAAYLPRFQALCESFGLKPTYLTNWEMAHDPIFQELGHDVLARGVAEIGMHLHAWDSPPIAPLTPDDSFYQPYLPEFPDHIMGAKVRAITDLLEGKFGSRPISHRAGRWGFDAQYARILAESGYRVDCSVTPAMSWKSQMGDPTKHGGPDFSDFPATPYFVDLDDIRRPGSSTLLEVPMTVVSHQYAEPITWARRVVGRNSFATRALNRLFPVRSWLYPGPRNRGRLLAILDHAVQEGRPYVEMALHSSELMPGGSPLFPSPASVDQLYETLEEVFAAARDGFEGATLAEYHASIVTSSSLTHSSTTPSSSG